MDEEYPDQVGAEVIDPRQKYAHAERLRVQRAWVGSGFKDRRIYISGLDSQELREDLLDVVRLLSGSSVATQTDAPSYIMALHGIHMETDCHRSIAIQNGESMRLTTSAVQCVEADIAVAQRSLRSHLDTSGALAISQSESESRIGSTVTSSPAPAMFRPTSSIPTQLYPSFMNDAQAIGISNRYGFVSLPQPSFHLPPRRRMKFIEPIQMPHLFGSHRLELGDEVVTNLSRANALWSLTSGFVPKY